MEEERNDTEDNSDSQPAEEAEKKDNFDSQPAEEAEKKDNFNRPPRRDNFNRPPRRDNFNRPPREMHKATCSACKKECEVPFKPTEGRDVFCRDCFSSQRR